MNRRDFIKASVPAVALPAIAITCKYEDDEKGPKKESKERPLGHCSWPYRVYCFERQQGEWTFTKNIKGSFSYQREYMTFEEDQGWPYAGWMDGGVLHFMNFQDATDFVDMHVRTKDDVNLIDSIYDIYYEGRYDEGEGGVEMHVAHYWFNGDTGTQIHWEADGFNMNSNKIEYA
jgi:hypothetical protein